MANINRDLERYLRNRKAGKKQPAGPGWFDSIFTSAQEEEEQELTPEEQESIEELENEIEQGEETLEVVHEVEEALEEQQEERVSIYHRILRMFRKDEAPQVEDEEPDEDEDDAREDFRQLAEIQVRWLSHLPLRARQAFRDSEDYQTAVEIFERRGVAKRKK